MTPRINAVLLTICLPILFFQTRDLAAFEMDRGIKIGAIFNAEDTPISVGFVGAGLPEGLDVNTAENDLIAIIEMWNSVTCSTINLELAAPGDRLDIPIYWGDNRTNDCIPEETDIGFTYFSPCINGDFTYERNSILLNSNPRYDWRHEPAPYQNSKEDHIVDLASVLTHEIGHALGLQHSDVSLSTMFPKYLLDGGMRSLAADDKFKLCAIYPSDKNECEDDKACPEGTCVSKNDVNVCEEGRSESGQYCALDDLRCKTCLVTSSATYTGYCTQTCDSVDNLCPSGLACADDGFCRLENDGVIVESCSTTRHFSTLSLFLFALVLTRRRVL